VPKAVLVFRVPKVLPVFKEIKEIKEIKVLKDVKEIRVIVESKAFKEIKETKEIKEFSAHRDPRDLLAQLRVLKALRVRRAGLDQQGLRVPFRGLRVHKERQVLRAQRGLLELQGLFQLETS
jgi:hypothetical protein